MIAGLTIAVLVLLGVIVAYHLNLRAERDEVKACRRRLVDEIRRHNEAAFRLGDEIAGLERAVESKDEELARLASVLKANEAECRRLEKVVIDKVCTCEDSDLKHQQAVAFVRDINHRIACWLTVATKPEDIPF